MFVLYLLYVFSCHHGSTCVSEAAYAFPWTLCECELTNMYMGNADVNMERKKDSGMLIRNFNGVTIFLLQVWRATHLCGYKVLRFAL